MTPEAHSRRTNSAVAVLETKKQIHAGESIAVECGQELVGFVRVALVRIGDVVLHRSVVLEFVINTRAGDDIT